MDVYSLLLPRGDSFGSLIDGSVEEQSGESDSGCSQPVHINSYICCLPNTRAYTPATAVSLRAARFKESSLNSIQDKRGEMRMRA